MNELAGLREALHERIEGMRIHSQRQGTWGIEYGDDRFMADVLRVIDEALAASSEGPGLDAAWAEVEAALPEGWSFYRIEQSPVEPYNYEATASRLLSTKPLQWDFIDGKGPTPAAALRALATRLASEPAEQEDGA